MPARFKSFMNKTSLVSGTLLLVLFTPSAAFADSSPSSSTSTDPTSSTPADNTPSSNTSSSDTTNSTPSSSSTTPSNSTSTNSSNNKQGPATPPGPASNTYTYDSSTGLWTNGYYSWNPTTGQTTPLTPQDYSYNPSTGMWDTTQYVYSPASGTYVPNTVSVSQPPAGSETTNSPATASNNNPVSTNTTSSPSGVTVNPDGTTNTNDFFNNFYNATISNTINADATSGDSLVVSNTAGGDSVSGNALDLANVINMIQSSSGLSGSDLATFVDNIMGDVNGNLLIDPRLLQSPNDPNNVADNLVLNSTDNGQINNNIALNATSGNATVANNTSGGDATSGNADAVANIINMINSIIAAHQSFLGVVNIYGNLTGNILVPSDLLNSLLADNGSSSTDPTNTTTVLNSTSNQSINNQVNTAAQSGQAGITDNTSAGNATSGNATTNVTIFNLTGSQIVASNSLLVFVNVLGQWVGFIMNAPAGTTAAAIGGGITSGTIGGNNTNVDAINNDQINNNVDVNAQSGDANVDHNTSAGNATSGNASSSVNLLNLTNSNLSLSNWFGVLFINVFGNWFGSLEGTDSLPSSSTTTTNNSNTSAANSVKGVGVFRFVPTSSGSNTYSISSIASDLAGQSGSSSSNNQQKAALVSYKTTPTTGTTITHTNLPASNVHLNFVPLGIGLAGLSVLGIEQVRSRSRRRNASQAASSTPSSKISDKQ